MINWNPERIAGHRHPHAERRSSHQTGHRVATFLLVALGIVGGAGSLLWLNSEWNRHINEETISSWATAMRERLDDPSKLLPGERFYSKVKVVAAGNSWNERLSMEQKETPVNVRSYPAVTLNGAEVPVIGKIAQGKEIFDVVLTSGVQPLSPFSGKWAVFNCSDAPGVSLDPKATSRICAIYGDYVVAGDNR